ncbi:hypothetical protein BYT27DRAFT_7219266, partial [Phlegmacium glaucopus]
AFTANLREVKSMLAVNSGFGRILKRVIPKADVEICQWSSLREKLCYSDEALPIIMGLKSPAVKLIVWINHILKAFQRGMSINYTIYMGKMSGSQEIPEIRENQDEFHGKGKIASSST